MKNSYYENAAFVRGSLTNEAREVITDRLFSIIEDGAPGDAMMAISHLFSLRNELSFGYKSVEVDDALGTPIKEQKKSAKDLLVKSLGEVMELRDEILNSKHHDPEKLVEVEGKIFAVSKKLGYI